MTDQSHVSGHRLLPLDDLRRVLRSGRMDIPSEPIADVTALTSYRFISLANAIPATERRFLFCKPRLRGMPPT